MPIAQRLLEIATFQRGPQDLPYSPLILTAVLAIAAGANLAAIALSPLNSAPWLTLAIFFGYTAAFVDGVLQMRGLAHRRVQTLAAVFGTDIVVVAVQVLALGLSGWEEPTPLMLAAFLLMLVWQLCVIAHILRHALSCGLGQAAAWTLAYFVGIELMMAILPGGQGT